MLSPFGSWKSCVCAWNVWDIHPQDSHKTVLTFYLGLRSHVPSLERPSSALLAVSQHSPHQAITIDKSNHAYLVYEDQRPGLSCQSCMSNS